MKNTDSDSTIISTRKPKDLPNVFFKKSHNLVFSQLSLTPVEHDILALFLTRLHKDHWTPFMSGEQVHSPTYSFSSDVLCDWFNVDSAVMYATLKEPAERLSEKSIGIKDDNSKGFVFRSLFKEIRYKNASLSIIPNDLLMNEYLAISGGHSQVPHKTFRNINKEHGKRLYTMLCRYRNPKFNVFHSQSLSDLHAYFGLLDKKGNLIKQSYKETAKFVQKILKPAILEVQKHEPNITFLYEEHGKAKKFGFEYVKEGRKVVGIKFLFKWNQKKAVSKDESQEREDLGNTPSPLEMAELTYSLVNGFVPNDSGNPTVAELNNLMSMSAQLVEKGNELTADFMQNFVLAMSEAKLRSASTPIDDARSDDAIEGELAK